uniref:Uncharacterized protein n=1 Tax=Arundo donax TaxID=35708 RepID=A0A0A9U0M7_ARUDO
MELIFLLRFLVIYSKIELIFWNASSMVHGSLSYCYAFSSSTGIVLASEPFVYLRMLCAY